MCNYCRALDKESRENGDAPDLIEITGKGYDVEHGDIICYIEQEGNDFYLRHQFTPSDGYYIKTKIKYCPECGRKL